MMDYEQTNTNSDLIYSKISSSIDKSKNILHKKALVLIKSLKEELGAKSFGLEGIKNYTKKIIDYLSILLVKVADLNNYTDDDEALEDDIKNAEALLFSLAVCIKQLPPNLLRNNTILDKIFFVLKSTTNSSNSLLFKVVNVKKYSLIILEKLFQSRKEAEMKDDHDIVMSLFNEKIFTFLEDAIKRTSSEENLLLKATIKVLSKILKDRNTQNLLKMSLVLRLKNFVIVKIRGMCLNPNAEEKNVLIGYENSIKTVRPHEAENVLKFLSAVIQFFPFDFTNDLILELTDLIEGSENIHILLHALLCFDVSFNTKKFALETSEKIIKILLTKEIIFHADLQREDPGLNVTTSLAIAYIKATSNVLLNIANVNVLIALKYFIAIISLFGEFLSSKDEFLKNSVYNSLSNLLNRLFPQNILSILLKPKTEEDEELTLEIKLEKETKFDASFILEKISSTLLYLVSNRFDDVKPGYNLLITFIEKLTRSAEVGNLTTQISPLLDAILYKLSEDASYSLSPTFKVFIGKLFNHIPASQVLKYFPISCLDYDICSEEYTENSKVWIISYLDKFLKSEATPQNLKEFFISLMGTIEDLEKIIRKLKSHNNDMEIDEEYEDERFDMDKNESDHIRNIKVKRFELILLQFWSCLPKFINYSQDYDVLAKEILNKLNNVMTNYNESCGINVPNIREIIFKTIGRMINFGITHNDMRTIEVMKKEGKFFFSKGLNMIINNKLSKNETQEAFNMIAKFCKISSEKFLCKIICDMIEKIDKITQDSSQFSDSLSAGKSTQAKLNESLNLSAIDTSSKPNLKKQKDKDLNTICLRVEIINYLAKNMKMTTPSAAHSNPSSSNVSFNENTNMSIPSSTGSSSGNTNLFVLLNTFFEKFFFKLSNVHIINKKLLDLFIILLSKIEDSEYTIEVFTKFCQAGGLEAISSKQKAKLFEFIIEILIKKLNQLGIKLDINYVQSQFGILIEIVTLTKDMNRKVRNLAYEMIGKITDFMSESNLFPEWIKMILAILASNSSFIKSAAINALARIYWQKRSNSTDIHNYLNETLALVLLLFRENNKEISKSIFVFLRVFLYLMKATNENLQTVSKILNACLLDTEQSLMKEFKVKLRNLLKNLIIKFSFEDIKKIIPNAQENLLVYINKYVVKKIKKIEREDSELHGYDRNTLDNSVMLDNEENLIDEEEEFIEKEFKKVEKKPKELKILENLAKFNLEEDDPELLKKLTESKNKSTKVDKIEELFKKDNIELENFFYVNPFAKATDHKVETAKEDTEADKDVFFDKKGKLIVKDLEREKEMSMMERKQKKERRELDLNEGLIQPGTAGMKMLKTKRVHNVAKDKDNFSDDEEGDYSKTKKKKEGGNKSRKIKDSHFVKFSGEEYKNKSGKGDKLLQGKYDPFTYIQLNPKSTSKKNRGDTLKMFKNLMHPSDK